MQKAETRALTLKVGKNEELEPCRCEACFSRRDLDQFRSVCSVPRPRGLYTNPRDARLGSPQIPIAPYPLVGYPAPSRTSLYPAHYNLHRPASYSRAFYFPAGPESRIYDLPRMKEMPREESTAHETRLVQSQFPQMRLNLETSNQGMYKFAIKALIKQFQHYFGGVITQSWNTIRIGLELEVDYL